MKIDKKFLEIYIKKERPNKNKIKKRYYKRKQPQNEDIEESAFNFIWEVILNKVEKHWDYKLLNYNKKL